MHYPTVQELCDYVNEFTESFEYKERLSRSRGWNKDPAGFNGMFSSSPVSEMSGSKNQEVNECTTLVSK